MFKSYKIWKRKKENKLLLFLWIILFVFGLIVNMSYKVSADSTTTLGPWDIFVVTANINPDFFEFLVRKELNSGTVIYFTDNAWSGNNTWRTWEWTITFTSTTTIPAGTVISINNPVPWSPNITQNTLGIVSKNGSFDLATAGDQILIYQWTLGDPNPSWIYGFGFAIATSWITSWSPTTNNSYLPWPLSIGSSAFAFTPWTRKSVQYSCTNRALFSDTFVDDFHNIANWEGNTDAWYFWPISCDFDAIKPYAAIELAEEQSGVTNLFTGKFLFSFSEPIHTWSFTCDDISLSGTANGKSCINIEEIAPHDWTEFEITVSANSSGTIVVDLNENKIQDIAGNPNTNSILIENSIVITVSESYYLTYNAWANGSLSGNTYQIVDVWENGTAIQAIADTGYHFVQRSDGITQNPRTDLNVTGNVSVTAEFAANPVVTYTLAYNAWDNGSLSGDTSQTVNEWENGSTVEAIADAGYHFVQRSDGSTQNPRTDTNITWDISVNAIFIADAAVTYTLDYSAGANGTLSGNTSQIVEENNDGSPVEAIANTGHHFVQRSDGSTQNPRTDLNVTGNVSVTAEFAANPVVTHTLTYIAWDNGYLIWNTTQTVNEWENGTVIEAIANNWYYFVRRSDSSTDNPRTDLNVIGNISVTAIFEEDLNSSYWTRGSKSTFLTTDNCPDGDESPSYYDGVCGDELAHWSAENKKEKFIFYPQIKRQELAQFVWKLTNDLLKLKVKNNIECNFEDIEHINEETKKYIVYSCKYWILWIDSDWFTAKKYFEPENIVSYNELATVLSRLLYWTKYNYEKVWYGRHVEQIEKIWLLNKWDIVTIELVARIFENIYKDQNLIKR